MPRPFVLPDLGEGLTEAAVIKVLVQEGDIVREDAPLLEVETDKAQVEIPSPLSGRVLTVHVRPNQTVRVGEPLVTFADAAESSATTAPSLARQVASPREEGAGVAQRGTDHVGPVPATPATRRLARELGVDLRAVRGSGPAGRVTDDDVRGAAPGAGLRGEMTGATAPVSGGEPAGADALAGPRPMTSVAIVPPPLPHFEQWGPVERQPLSHLRRTIAERMVLSATVIPHVTHFDRADITELDAFILRNLEFGRTKGVTLTLTGFLLRATALALREHPQFNASLDTASGELIVKRYYHLGVAVATERGLIVPVLRNIDAKPLLEVARELESLAARVREGKATLDDLRGGTFTITNIGALGGTGVLPLINYPEVAILGAARGRLEPTVRDGQIVPRMMLPLSLTFDHRVADGVDGARLMSAIIRRLERPEELLLEL
jgi:pyruvate dehydrogenase E2 component (dihydrolipoamide acetyltransferase)